MNILIVIPQKGYLNDFIVWLKTNFKKFKITISASPSPFCKNKFHGKFQIILCFLFNSFYFTHLFFLKRNYDYVLLDGMLVSVPYLFLVKVFQMLPNKKRQKIFIIHFYIHKMGSNRIIKRFLISLLSSPDVILLVQSMYEKDYYSSIKNNARVIYFPYCQGEVSFVGSYGEGEKYIFSGGYTNRDYKCLCNAAKKIDHDFIIVCSKLNRITETLPNLKILRDIGDNEFFCYLNNSKIVVIPLEEDTGSSGQMVALAAMYLKKAIIYTNVSSINQYFEDGITGISYEKRNSEDLASKISYLLQNNDLCYKLGISASKKFYESFHINRYYEFLMELFEKNLQHQQR